MKFMLILLWNLYTLNFLRIFFPYKEKRPTIFYKDGLASTSKKKVWDEPFTFHVQEQIIEPRRGNIIKVPKNFGIDFLSFMASRKPQTYKEAMTSPKAFFFFWKEAINNEVESILQNNT